MVTEKSILFFDKDEYKVEKKEGKYLFVSEKYKNWLKTSETGKCILYLLDGKRTISDIITCISEEYEMPKFKIEQHIIDFCIHLDDINFLSKERANEGKYLEDVFINITTVSEFICIYDNKLVTKVKDNQKHMTINKLKDILANLKDRIVENKTNIHITGGEPLLNPYVIDILEYVKGLNYDVSLWTSGINLDDDMCDKLKNLVKCVYLPLDSSDKTLNDEIRGVGAYETSINAGNVLCKNEIKFFYTTTPINQNFKNVVNVVDAAYNVGALGVIINEPVKIRENGTKLEKLFDYTNEEYIELERKFMQKANVINSWKNNNLKNEGYFNVLPSRFRCMNTLGTIRGRNTCGMGINVLSVGVEGDVYPCNMLHVKDMRLKNAEEGLTLYSKTHHEDCEECVYKLFCLGGCKAIDYYVSEDLKQKYSKCEYMKAMYNQLLWG